ncbi:hypothetical protein [Paenibacillus sp. USHLN196]
MKWNILPMIRKKVHQLPLGSLWDTADSRTLIFAGIDGLDALLILQF